MCIYIYIHSITCVLELSPISLPRQSLLRLLDSNLPGSSPWAWESLPLEFIFCLSQAL